MANDVVLGAAMRANLLSLQNTQRSIDATQLRLATGKKVNSALDGPQSFFTAQSLNNRASDLTRLLDGIGQSIRTIEEADAGVTALTKLVEQADSIVNSARDELAATDGEARMLGNVDLRNVTDITATAFGGAQIANNDQIRIVTTNDAGAQISQTITLTTGDSAYTLAAKITDAFADNQAGEVTASINSSTGYLEISSKGGRSFKIGDGAAVGTGTGIGTAGYNALGIGRYFELEQRGVASANYVNATINAGNTAKSISLYEAPGNLVDVGDTIAGSTFTNASGTTVIGGIQTNDQLSFQINNGAAVNITLAATTTWQDVIDQVNGNATYNRQIRLGWDDNAGQFTVTSLLDSVENVSLSVVTSATTSTGRTFNLGLGDPSGTLDPLGALAVSSTYETVIGFNSSTQALDQFSKDFNTIRDQINSLVEDAQYRGVNLLRGDNLTTFFNEDGSNNLVTEGATFTSDGLGLTVANFTSSESIEAMSDRVFEALGEVRSFGSSLANNLSIIQTRRDFTEQTINTLKAGASDLTDADLNEEGANLLALQTAQQLGVTSLSLASQSQQSVLRLF